MQIQTKFWISSSWQLHRRQFDISPSAWNQHQRDLRMIIVLNQSPKKDLLLLPGIGAILSERVIRCRTDSPFRDFKDFQLRVQRLPRHLVADWKGMEGLDVRVDQPDQTKKCPHSLMFLAVILFIASIGMMFRLFLGPSPNEENVFHFCVMDELWTKSRFGTETESGTKCWRIARRVDTECYFVCDPTQIDKTRACNDSMEFCLKETVKTENEDPHDTLLISKLQNEEIVFVEFLSEKFHFLEQKKSGWTSVWLVEHTETKQQYILKKLPKSNPLAVQVFVTEHEILLKLGKHKNIVSHYGSFETPREYAIVTEYCSGGNADGKVAFGGYFTESETIEFAKDVLHGLKHIHSKHIGHRDLKLENVVFQTKDGCDDEWVVKIIDFGISEEIHDPMEADNSEFKGSYGYTAPEFDGNATTKGMMHKADMWSLGACVWALCTGGLPYPGYLNTESLSWEDRYSRVLDAFDPSTDRLSDSCKDFILRLLTKDVEQRMDVDTALQHEWITGNHMEGNRSWHAMKKRDQKKSEMEYKDNLALSILIVIVCYSIFWCGRKCC